MAELQSNIEFRIMSLMFRSRDLFSPRRNILKEVGITKGFRILDYGCGAGSYIVGASELVGESGMVCGILVAVTETKDGELSTVPSLTTNENSSTVSTGASGITKLADTESESVTIYPLESV